MNLKILYITLGILSTELLSAQNNNGDVVGAGGENSPSGIT